MRDATPKPQILAGAVLVTVLLAALTVFGFVRFRVARQALEAAQAEMAARAAENQRLAVSALLVKGTRFKVKAESSGTFLGIGSVHQDDTGAPQVFQTSACGETWAGQPYAAGTLDLAVSTRDCSWGGQVAFYVLQFRSDNPQYPRPVTLIGSWGNPGHVSDSVVRLP